jgi:hypothetical protein
LYTPLVYYAVGFPPLAPRPVRTEHASYRGRLSGLHLTPQGQTAGGLVNPSKFRLEVLFDMAAWCHRESPLTLHREEDPLRPDLCMWQGRGSTRGGWAGWSFLLHALALPWTLALLV